MKKVIANRSHLRQTVTVMKNATENKTKIQNGLPGATSRKNANMKTRTIERRDEHGKLLKSVVARVPETQDVLNLKVGDLAPDSFGGLGRVTRIYYLHQPPQYSHTAVGYYTAMGEGDTPENGCGCSQSMKAGELICSVALTGLLTSAECDDLERDMNGRDSSAPNRSIKFHSRHDADFWVEQTRRDEPVKVVAGPAMDNDGWWNVVVERRTP